MAKKKPSAHIERLEDRIAPAFLGAEFAECAEGMECAEPEAGGAGEPSLFESPMPTGNPAEDLDAMLPPIEDSESPVLQAEDSSGPESGTAQAATPPPSTGE